MASHDRYAGLLVVSLLSLSFTCAHSRHTLNVRAAEDFKTGLHHESIASMDGGFSVSSISYLLFASAEPLAHSDGSSSSLLPFLRPVVLDLFNAHCKPTLAMDLNQLAQRMSGTRALQACEYDLYKSLQATFAWVRDNVALRLQEVDGQPDAAFALPDMSKLELAAAVRGALADDTKLGNIAATVESRCGLSSTDFAALVPDVSSALMGLHAELALLQSITRDLASGSPRTTPLRRSQRRDDEVVQQSIDDNSSANDDGVAIGSRSNARKSLMRREARVVEVDGLQSMDDSTGSAGVKTSIQNDVTGGGLSSWFGHIGSSVDVGQRASGSAAATAALRKPQNFVYNMPPKSKYVYAHPASMPPILLPLIFHVFSYGEKKDIGPKYLERSPSYADRLVRIANLITKPANVQFYVKEVRTNVNKYPYLRVKSYDAWINSPDTFLGCATNDTEVCMAAFNGGYPFSSMVGDFGRSINVFISSNSYVVRFVGYAYMPLSNVYPSIGYVWLSWNTLMADDDLPVPLGAGNGFNNVRMFELGGNGLAHEAFHALGVDHPFKDNCTDADYDDILDTPIVSKIGKNYAGDSASANSFCVKKFWEELKGDWDLIYQRWNRLGIPDEDKNAWLDSCPEHPGYDDIGNWMTYAPDVCNAVLGHFTYGQAERAHLVTSEVNPMMYAWGQYYAQMAAPPPPAQVLPPSPPGLPISAAYSNFSICMATPSKCWCKDKWTFKGKLYSGCSQVDGIESVYPGALYCEVANATGCEACGTTSPCIQRCAGNYTDCMLPASPPPPFPPSPPPMPPPPPPRGMPDACKRAANGCECMRTWEDVFGSAQTYWSYCAPGYGSVPNQTLWCQVTPSCPDFPRIAFFDCSAELTAEFCGGGQEVIFSTSRLPSSPPPPPTPNPPPSPPSPRPPKRRRPHRPNVQ